MENIPRVVPDDLSVRLNLAWPSLPVFDWIAETGVVPADDMRRTFNLGIGMTLIVSPDTKDPVVSALRDAGEEVYEIGSITARGDGPDIVLVD